MPTAALDPKNYAFVPSQWTQRIRPSGRFTNKSDNLGSVLQNNYLEGESAGQTINGRQRSDNVWQHMAWNDDKKAALVGQMADCQLSEASVGYDINEACGASF